MENLASRVGHLAVANLAKAHHIVGKVLMLANGLMMMMMLRMKPGPEMDGMLHQKKNMKR